MRSRLERKVDLLRTIREHRGYPLTRVSSIARLDFYEGKIFFDELVKSGLLVVNGQGKFRNISVTMKGFKALRKFDEIKEEFGE